MDVLALALSCVALGLALLSLVTSAQNANRARRLAADLDRAEQRMAPGATIESAVEPEPRGLLAEDIVYIPADQWPRCCCGDPDVRCPLHNPARV